MNLSEQTQIILISKSKQLQLYHFPCAKLGNALPLLPWQGYGSPECQQCWGSGLLWGGQELTPLLFRDSSRGTLGQIPAGKVRWGDGEVI